MDAVVERSRSGRSVREIPMSEEVEAAFRAIIAKRVKPKVEPMIGYSGFLYLAKTICQWWLSTGRSTFSTFFRSITASTRSRCRKVTPHVCRHTFCSKMAKRGMNPKSLQYIMGHSDISVTLNTYTHVKFEDAEAEMKRVVAI